MERNMKKHSRIISILLAMLMVLTSLSIVFAVDEVTEEPQTDGSAVVTETPGETAPAVENEELVAEPQDAALEEAPGEGEEPAATDTEPVMVDVTIKYVYEDGTEAAKTFTGQVEAGTEYSFPSPPSNRPGYAPDKEAVTGTAVEGTPVDVTVTYKAAATKEVANLQLHPAYLSIILTWDRVEDAKEYVVQKQNANGVYEDVDVVPNSEEEMIRWKDYDAKGTEGTFSKAKTYYYKVFSVSQTDIRSEAGSAAKGTCVRPMYETVTFKKAAKLTSHSGPKQTITFKKGQTVTCYGFSGGKYRFYYNGSQFWANYVRVKNCKAEYQANAIANGKATIKTTVGKKTKSVSGYTGIWARQNYASSNDGTYGTYDTKLNVESYEGIRYYDRISAEDFVNDHGINPPVAAPSSKTQYLIWVSTYQQHLYVFEGSAGNWELIKDWECATGAAKSPTPTGHGKVIWKKIKKRSGIKYWSPFQTMNSIHGQKSIYTFGAPASNGCVRNYNENAIWVYDNCNTGKNGQKAKYKNTAVVIW